MKPGNRCEGIQIIGGVRTPSPPAELDAESTTRYSKLLGISTEEFMKLFEECRQREGARLTQSRLKALVEFDATTAGLNFIGQAREALKFDEYENAVKCADQAIAVFRGLVEAGLVVESVQHLADALAERGKALSRLKQHAEAVASYDEVLALEKRVRDERGDSVFSLAHADSFMDKGLVLTNAGQREEGDDCYQTALKVYRRFWSNGDSAAGGRVALCIFNLGEADRGAGRFREAIAHYDEALEIHRKLSTDNSANAGIVLINKSRALDRLEEFEAALMAAKTAASILEPLAAEEPLKLELAGAVLWQGRALERLYRLTEASECFKRSTELVREVKRKRGTYREPVEQ